MIKKIQHKDHNTILDCHNIIDNYIMNIKSNNFYIRGYDKLVLYNNDISTTCDALNKKNIPAVIPTLGENYFLNFDIYYIEQEEFIQYEDIKKKKLDKCLEKYLSIKNINFQKYNNIKYIS